MSVTKHPESAVLCTGLQSERLVKQLGERQVALHATSKVHDKGNISGWFKGAALEIQITLALLSLLKVLNAHKCRKLNTGRSNGTCSTEV